MNEIKKQACNVLDLGFYIMDKEETNVIDGKEEAYVEIYLGNNNYGGLLSCIGVPKKDYTNLHDYVEYITEEYIPIFYERFMDSHSDE